LGPPPFLTAETKEKFAGFCFYRIESLTYTGSIRQTP